MAEAAVDPQQGNNPDEPTRPDWLPENFDNPEALVKSYQEAQNKIREQGTQLNALNENYASLSDQLEQIQAAQQQPQQFGQQNDAYVEQLNDLFATNPAAAAALVSQQIVQQQLQQQSQQWQQQWQPNQDAQAAIVADLAYNSLASRYGDDFEQHRDQMHELIQTQPWLIPDSAQTDPRAAAAAIENVYKLVNPGAFVPVVEHPQDQLNVTAMKQAAQSAQGAGGRPLSPSETEEEWAKIKAAAPPSYYG